MKRSYAFEIVTRAAGNASEQFEELRNGEAGVAYESAQRSDRQLLVLRNGQVDTDSGFHKDEVTSDLSERLPAGLLKCTRCLSSRDVRQSAHY